MKPLTDREKIELVLKLDNASQRTAQTNKGYKKLDRLMIRVSEQMLGRKLASNELEAIRVGYFSTALNPRPNHGCIITDL